ncbi:response regulator [Dyadobacter flavalbus]|uniref:Response regulator n=2 Tax=Dyadobacter flavalbus TaxID=2579942 RepID=A0A5M8QSZ5_9BACT|nr:response regulator [Dyadobacter flavalbus]KAA6439377.1 response regulator [Dyadobacter flavalbus]
MEINMPRVGGIEGKKLLKQHDPETSIIMQTAFEETEMLAKLVKGVAIK